MFTLSSQKNKPKLGQLLSEVMMYKNVWLLIFNIHPFVQMPMSANLMKMAATRMPTASTLKAVLTVVAKKDTGEMAHPVKVRSLSHPPSLKFNIL